MIIRSLKINPYIYLRSSSAAAVELWGRLLAPWLQIVYPKSERYNRLNYFRCLKPMTDVTLDETKLKELLKTAIVELLQEEKDVFSELLSDVLEEIGMINAIKEGENTKVVSQEKIFEILKNNNAS